MKVPGKTLHVKFVFNMKLKMEVVYTHWNRQDLLKAECQKRRSVPDNARPTAVVCHVKLTRKLISHTIIVRIIETTIGSGNGNGTD